MKEFVRSVSHTPDHQTTCFLVLLISVKIDSSSQLAELANFAQTTKLSQKMERHVKSMSVVPEKSCF